MARNFYQSPDNTNFVFFKTRKYKFVFLKTRKYTFVFLLTRKYTFVLSITRKYNFVLSPENTNFRKYTFVLSITRKYTFVLSPENTNYRKNKFVFLNTIYVEKYKFCINNTVVLLLGGANTLWPKFLLCHFFWTKYF
jgi:hypothetical protein